MRISWRSFTGYRPKAAGKARTASTMSARPRILGFMTGGPARATSPRSRAARGPSPERPAEQALGPGQDDERHDHVDHEHRDPGQPHFPEGLGLADDEAPHERALERSETAHDDHDQGRDEDADAHRGVGGLDRAGDDAGQPAECRAEGEDEREDAADVDPEPGGHLGVVDARANDGAEARLLDHEPEEDRHQQADYDEEDAIGRNREAAEG